MRVGQTLRVLTRPIILYPKCLNQTTSNQCNRKVELHLQWMLSKKAISQVLELLQSRTRSFIQLSKIALTDSLRNAIHNLQTANSQIQRNQHLSNRYYLWINVVYYLDLTLYDKWQTYSFKNSPIQVKAILLKLANARLQTLYNNIEPCKHNILANTTINKQNAKIQLLFDNSFTSYETQLQSTASKTKTYTTLIRQGFKWELFQQLGL